MRVTKEKLSEILGTSERQITRWISAGLPCRHQGGGGRADESIFSTVDVVRWLIDRAVVRAQRESPDAALRRVQLRRAELDLAEKCGALIAVADVGPVWEAAILAARTDLLTLGPRFKIEVQARYGVEIDAEIVNELVRAALVRLSQHPPEEGDAETPVRVAFDDDDADDLENEAAAEALPP